MSAPVTRAVAVDPDILAPPFARYSHGCEVSFPPERATRMVFVSGQLGVRPDGTCDTDAYAQAVQCLLRRRQLYERLRQRVQVRRDDAASRIPVE